MDGALQKGAEHTEGMVCVFSCLWLLATIYAKLFCIKPCFRKQDVFT